MNASAQRPRFEMANKGSREGRKQMQRPKAWNHQDDLKASIGKTIRVAFTDGDVVVGTLVASDQFTIKVACEIADANDRSLMTYFKGNLFGYSIEG